MILRKKIGSFKKLAKKVKVIGGRSEKNEYLLSEEEETTTPTGFCAVYVGEERERFVVPTGFLSHPLFKMLLEKSYNEFGFEHESGVVIPCSVSAFQRVFNAVGRSNSRFDFGQLVEELVV